MSVLDIDRHIEDVPKNRIARIGLEVEGGWLKAPKGSSIIRDGSVKNFPEDIPLLVGEIASPPLIPVQGEVWLVKNYPTHINETCGLHIHMSFDSALNYMRLMTPNYQDTMMEYLLRWAKEEKIPATHHFYSRLKGESEFCQLKYWPDKQVIQRAKDYDRKKDGHRYTAVNYCHGLKNMQTLEVRVMPMFDTPQQGARAIKRVQDITNGCLVQLNKKEDKLEADFPLNTGTKLVDQLIAVYR